MPSAAQPTLLIFGAGGHGRVVADAAIAQGTWGRVIATDRNPAKCRGELLPGVALAAIEALEPYQAVHVAIGDARSREREAAAAGAPLATVVHPRASVSAHAIVGDGTLVAAQAVLAPTSQVGTAVIVNHGAVVDHDAEAGDFSHLGPLSALGGAARVGRRVLLGSGAKVLPGVSVCDDVTIGAGAVVAANITEPGVYAGVPARRLR
ncbi:MAG TPA: NeuD/PglB/VioB family sugar acetyltransferase [Ramlibacter sp.]|jgi:sugar O-acyltransferase (sialic acid O-acetyltransferase NeuD family)|nr:NeuD/PglB/VioB family sugar acetyltransferase [Ramlibacter sp.]